MKFNRKKLTDVECKSINFTDCKNESLSRVDNLIIDGFSDPIFFYGKDIA